MTSLKPSKNQLIDMIAKRLMAKIDDEMTETLRQKQQLSQQQAQLTEERDNRAYGADLETEREQLESLINAALVENGYGTITVDARVNRAGKGVEGVFNLGQVKGPRRRLRKTKRLDTKLHEISKAQRAAHSRHTALTARKRDFQMECDYRKTEMRSRIIAKLSEKDEELQKAITAAADAISAEAGTVEELVAELANG